MKTILKFYSPICSPCKLVGKNLEQLEDVEIKSIDITDSNNKEWISTYSVKSIPTVIVLNEDGTTKETFRGIVTADKVKEVL